MSKEINKKLFHEQQLLGHRVGRNINFLAVTACMNPEERQKLALTNAFTKIVNYNRAFPKGSFQDFLEKCMIPIIQELGYANWERDVLTDLSLATSIIVKTEISATLTGIKESGN